jgi:ribA/ribD-fused uncharacterized protein
MSEEFTLFWDGPFSQWEPSIFEIDGIEYSCAEQYMMASKARLFEDENTLEEIMEAEDPGVQKALGRQVADFDVDTWQEDEDNGRPRCWNIVWQGNMAKFSQNPHLLKRLKRTVGTTLAEASPYDLIWGIGLRASDPRAQNRENWDGMNWLGEVLNSVRSFLVADPLPYTSTDDQRQPL